MTFCFHTTVRVEQTISIVIAPADHFFYSWPEQNRMFLMSPIGISNSVQSAQNDPQIALSSILPRRTTADSH